ncbi:MAG: deoxyribodipyrimidine photo-lyase [Planctomycetaceae bacterium]|nr:deoxyribodipyrimidine photo-lyase [Planctomycetaceae bacterium]
MSQIPYGVHWFRRDLRVAGNPALQWNWKQHRGRVLGLFAFDRKFLSRPDFSHNRFAFFLQTLKVLRDELRSVGGDLLVLDVGPEHAFQQLFAALEARQLARPAAVSFNRDYEPFARERDGRISTWLPQTFGVAVHTERDHVLIEPDELTRDGAPGALYQVYSPFAKRWFDRLATDDVRQRIESQKKALAYLDDRRSGKVDGGLFSLTWSALFGGTCPVEDHLDASIAANSAHVTVPIPPAGSLAALERLREFRRRSLKDYKDRRDYPSVDATSRLSIYFKNGSITPAMVLAETGLEHSEFKNKDGPTHFVKEIAWREFYYHVLHHRPEVEHSAFLERYRDLPWENREDWFEAWKQGLTGFPIVDAGMRQLLTTGWMHNRVRMIVASFLTKDLLIDWKWGERWFMEQLLDGDLAPNNGGWQWAASTGCDPQPYFRIFNPKLQSEKFDGDGDYIREFVPELREVNSRAIHEPYAHGYVGAYPAPIVEHSVQRDKALSLYRIESGDGDQHSEAQG